MRNDIITTSDITRKIFLLLNSRRSGLFIKLQRRKIYNFLFNSCRENVVMQCRELGMEIRVELNYNFPQLVDGVSACPHSAIIKSIITRVLFRTKKPLSMSTRLVCDI